MNIVIRLLKAPYRIAKYVYDKNRFGSIGFYTRIVKPLRIEHPENIFLDDNVSIHEYSWLAANPLDVNPIGGGKVDDWKGHNNRRLCSYIRNQ